MNFFSVFGIDFFVRMAIHELSMDCDFLINVVSGSRSNRLVKEDRIGAIHDGRLLVGVGTSPAVLTSTYVH